MLYGYGSYVEKRKQNQYITLYICVFECTDVVQTNGKKYRERERKVVRGGGGGRDRDVQKLMFIKSIKVELTQNILK